MKYFAKYLPVDGKPITGDSIKFNIESTAIHHNIIVDNSSIYTTDNKLLFDKKGTIKVKLFLCSKDIQVGDEVVCDEDISEKAIVESLTSSGLIRLRVNKEFYTDVQDSCFKVIGEISKDAIWIREGDKFDLEDNVLAYHMVKNAYSVINHININIPNKGPIRVQCPTCNSFH